MVGGSLMNMRVLGLSLLVVCILGGILAALFAPTLAATLTLPAKPGAGSGQVALPTSTQAVPQPTTKTITQPTKVATVGNNPGAQVTQPAAGTMILAQDTFQRTNQQFWGTSSDGRLWGIDANSNNAFSIVNHTGQIMGGKGIFQATLNVASA